MKILNILFAVGVVGAILAGVFSERSKLPEQSVVNAQVISKREYFHNNTNLTILNLKLNTGGSIELNYQGRLSIEVGDVVPLQKHLSYSPRVKWHPSKSVSYKIIEDGISPSNQRQKNPDFLGH